MARRMPVGKKGAADITTSVLRTDPIPAGGAGNHRSFKWSAGSTSLTIPTFFRPDFPTVHRNNVPNQLLKQTVLTWAPRIWVNRGGSDGTRGCGIIGPATDD